MEQQYFWHDFLLDTAAILWPTECVGCGSANRDLCNECHRDLKQQTGIKTIADHPLSFEPWTFAGDYEGVLRELIVHLKHGGRDGFHRALADPLKNLLRPIMADRRAFEMPFLVPVPSRPKRVRERGFNHLEIIGKRALKNLGLPKGLFLDALRAAPGRTGQVGLRSAERRQNANLLLLRERAQQKLLGREVIVLMT